VVESICQLNLRIPSYVRVNTLTKWWVEPKYVALPIPACPLRCILSVRKFVIKVTMSKGVLHGPVV
jgi:hypothetical protein